MVKIVAQTFLQLELFYYITNCFLNMNELFFVSLLLQFVFQFCIVTTWTFSISEGTKVRQDHSSTCLDVFVSHCDKLEHVSEDAFLGVRLCYVSSSSFYIFYNVLNYKLLYTYFVSLWVYKRNFLQPYTFCRRTNAYKSSFYSTASSWYNYGIFSKVFTRFFSLSKQFVHL